MIALPALRASAFSKEIAPVLRKGISRESYCFGNQNKMSDLLAKKKIPSAYAEIPKRCVSPVPSTVMWHFGGGNSKYIQPGGHRNASSHDEGEGRQGGELQCGNKQCSQGTLPRS